MSNRKSTFFYSVLLALASLTAGMVIASRLDMTTGSFARTVNVPATNSAPLTGSLDASTFRNIAHDQSASVVTIVISATVHASRMPQGIPPELQDFLQRQGGRRGGQPQAEEQDQEVEGAGSGFIIDKAGFILTNNHVIEDADQITVHLLGAGEFDAGYPATVVGRDPLTDSALIKMNELPKAPLQEAKFGDSDQMQPGDWVMAIGNPFELSHSVSVGVVSGIGRFDPTIRAAFKRDVKLIQTDAAINKGNSGGPLLNIRGEVIGINNQILTNETEGNIGIGFAIPINTIRDILPQLRTGKVVRGRIGLSVDRHPFTADQITDLGLPDGNGAIVEILEAKGAAENAGIHLGDVIVEFNGKQVKDSGSLVDMVVATPPNTTVPIKVVRDKKPLMLNIKIDEFRADAPAPANETVVARPVPPEPQSKDTSLGMEIQRHLAQYGAAGESSGG